jgi:hypothetical protein
MKHALRHDFCLGLGGPQRDRHPHAARRAKAKPGQPIQLFCILDAKGGILERGRIEHTTPEFFVELVGRHSKALAVFETTMGMGSIPTGRSGGAKLAAERIARSL